MKSKVFYIKTTENESVSMIQKKLSRLIDRTGLCLKVPVKSNVVVKVHFGEEGNTGHVNPFFIKVLSEKLHANHCSVVLSDTNTLYRGRRMESEEHRKLAIEHGFTEEISGAKVIIPDENEKSAIASLPINLKHIRDAKIPKIYLEADYFIAVSHFKGHIMAGFGGALKNLGMGCATREGKLAQHSNIAPKVYSANCVSCGACVDVCPVDAIRVNTCAVIDIKKCIGCASCISVCPSSAIDVQWDAGSNVMIEKMVEYASALLSKQKNTFYINFATKITAECDCMAKDDPRIVADVGILASFDPVSLDQATYDQIRVAAEGEDVFECAHPDKDGLRQLSYAETLGLGRRDYELEYIDL